MADNDHDANNCCPCNDHPQKPEPLVGEILSSKEIIHRASWVERAVGWMHRQSHLQDDVTMLSKGQRDQREQIVETREEIFTVKKELATFGATVEQISQQVKFLQQLFIAGIVVGGMFVCTTVTLIVVYARH